MKKSNKNKQVDTDAIKAKLNDAGISYAEFGRNIGLNDRSLISDRLSNKYSFTADELISAAKFLQCSVDELCQI